MRKTWYFSFWAFWSRGQWREKRGYSLTYFTWQTLFHMTCVVHIAQLCFGSQIQGMVWNEIKDDFSIIRSGNFLWFHFHSVLKIFHSILKFSSIFYSILPYQGKFRLEETYNLYSTVATLSVPLQVVSCKDKQHGTMHLISYLKYHRNELPQKFTQHENTNHSINRQ